MILVALRTIYKLKCCEGKKKMKRVQKSLGAVTYIKFMSNPLGSQRS